MRINSYTREDLIEYIKKKHGVNTINSLIEHQIDSCITLGYSFKAVQSTLEYFYDVRRGRVMPNTIGIVFSVYEEAKQYYYDLGVRKEKIREKAGNMPSTIEIKVKRVKEPTKIREIELEKLMEVSADGVKR